MKHSIQIIVLLLTSFLTSNATAQTVKNQNFEEVIDGFPSNWEIKNGIVELDSNSAYSGKYCMKIIDTSYFVSVDFRSSIFEIEPNSINQLSIQFKALQCTPGIDPGNVS